MLLLTTALALAAPLVCADPGEPLTLEVAFSAGYENRVLIRDIDGTEVVARFSNRSQNATRVWRAPERDRCTCYRLEGIHDPGGGFRASKVLIEGRTIGWEDSTDADYNDARVRILEGRIPDDTTPACEQKINT